MEKYKLDAHNKLCYELGENGCYYPIIELNNEDLEIGRYTNLAMLHMEKINPVRYKTLGMLGMFSEIFKGIDDKVYKMIDEIMKKKLKSEPIQEDWNVIEITTHKKMLYREAEEIALKEIVYKDHFANIDMEEILE